MPFVANRKRPIQVKFFVDECELGMTASTQKAMYRMEVKVFGVDNVVNPFVFWLEG